MHHQNYPLAIQTAFSLLDAYAERFADGIQLYAGSSVLSPLVERAMCNRMGGMPAMGEPYDKQQPGTNEISAMEVLLHKQLTDVFGGVWSEARLQSCTYANAAVYAAFSAPGEGVATIPAEEGGHVSHHAEGTIGVLGRKVVPLCAVEGRYDDRRSAQCIRDTRPRIVMLGASVMLDPYEVTQTLAAARDVGALSVYDASHVAGLIAGQAYQNPLDLGFDMMTTSTYKSLCGPVGGAIVGSDPAHQSRLARQIVGGWTSNYDASRLAGLVVALAEAQVFMADYARAMIRNAGLLRDALAAQGVDAIVSAQQGNDTPTSHHVVIVLESIEVAKRLSRQAEAAGLYVGTARVPGRATAGGLRIGTQVITRQGVDVPALIELAGCMRAIIDGNPPTSIQSRVRQLASRLRALRYAFPSD